MGKLLLSAMRGNLIMNLSRVKRVTTGAALAFVFLFSVGVFTGTTANAQDRNRRWDRNDRRDRDWDRNDWNRRQQIERARAIERARQLQWERERARNRYAYSYPRTYPSYGGNYGGYGGYTGSNYEVQKGYRDGLDRGQEDLQDRRAPNPNNSSHYRSGNAAYREGFRRGYAEGYRQFGYRR